MQGRVIDRCEEVVHFLVVDFGVGEPDGVLVVAVDGEHGRVDVAVAVTGGHVVEEVGERRGAGCAGEVGGEGVGGPFGELDAIQAYGPIL